MCIRDRAQVALAEKAFAYWPAAKKVVDPVMGDHGRPYRTITPQMRSRLGELVRVADIITPNLTEACMLLKIPYFNEGLSRAQAKSLLVRLSELGPNYVVITGAPMASGSIANIGYDRQNNSFWYIDCDYVPVSYPGTGDLFASVLTGGFLTGDSLPMAMGRAAYFVERCIKTTFSYSSDTRYGVMLEKELGVPLFYRSGRNIALTTYGEALQNALTPVLKTLHQIPTQLQQMALEREKTIRLNVLAASTLVTQALISYKKDHDGLHFRLIQNSQCEDADITVFTRENFQIPTDTKERYELFKERIFLAVPHNSPYASEESVRLQDFAHEDFISLSGSRSIRTICDRYCMQAGFVPHIIYESDSPDTVKNLIASGLGVGFWPHYTWGMDSMEPVSYTHLTLPTTSRV